MHVYKAKQYRCNRLFDAELSSKMTKPILLKNIFHLTLIIISIYRRFPIMFKMYWCMCWCIDVLQSVGVVCAVYTQHSSDVLHSVGWYYTVFEWMVLYGIVWYCMVPRCVGTIALILGDWRDTDAGHLSFREGWREQMFSKSRHCLDWLFRAFICLAESLYKQRPLFTVRRVQPFLQ